MRFSHLQALTRVSKRTVGTQVTSHDIWHIPDQKHGVDSVGSGYRVRVYQQERQPSLTISTYQAFLKLSISVWALYFTFINEYAIERIGNNWAEGTRWKRHYRSQFYKYWRTVVFTWAGERQEFGIWTWTPGFYSTPLWANLTWRYKVESKPNEFLSLMLMAVSENTKCVSALPNFTSESFKASDWLWRTRWAETEAKIIRKHC